jgi:DNA excision repair protein ERCC-2
MMETKEESKVVSISIREFAMPSPRTGSIDALSGYGRAALEGIEIHQRVQSRREKQHDNYHAEKMTSHRFERGRFVFEVQGRMDGFFEPESEGTPPRIEEIKSTFNVYELSRRLQNPGVDHPYLLQLQTYGYFYFIQNGVMPKLSFYLLSTRNSDTDSFDIELKPALYEAWLERRLEELEAETEKAEKRAARRKRISAAFPFPFEKLRRGQAELVRTVEQGMVDKKRMLIQAPTGMGKTAGVFYPSLKEAMSRGQRVVYVTPKNSQHAVAEDAVERFQDSGAAVRSLTITAKGKICFKNEPLCNPEYCEFARDYYTKVHSHGLIDKLAKKKKLSAKTFREMGEQFEVCPFELQIDSAADADAVICDYNYVFGPRSALGRLNESGIDQTGKPNLVIDEAHNLPARAMDYYSPALSSVALEKMREEVRELPLRFRTEAEQLLDECLSALIRCAPDGGTPKPVQIKPPAEPFMDQDVRLRTFLSRYLDSGVEIQPRDVVLRLCFYWAEFSSALEFLSIGEHPEFFTTFHPHHTGGTVKITCCDASEMLKECYDSYDQVVGFSATLKPFEYYSKLSGLDPESTQTAEFASPFAPEHRKLLIIPQISTKYSERERNYAKIAEAIEKITKLRAGNYFAFFPSFDFMERVLGLVRPPEGFVVLRQEREMKANAIEAVIEHLKSRAQPTLVFAVQGGVFSEGVDYPGESVIGAFVVGPPLPSFDLEREEMRKYYDEVYGAGFDYAYAFPAMAKAVQAAGRVIRSETDRGLIVLMDSRFVQPSYSRSMPSDWFSDSARELVSASILKEVASFWEQKGEA